MSSIVCWRGVSWRFLTQVHSVAESMLVQVVGVGQNVCLDGGIADLGTGRRRLLLLMVDEFIGMDGGLLVLMHDPGLSLMMWMLLSWW